MYEDAVNQGIQLKWEMTDEQYAEVERLVGPQVEEWRERARAIKAERKAMEADLAAREHAIRMECNFAYVEAIRKVCGPRHG